MILGLVKSHVLSMVEPVTESGCWIWSRCLDVKGYGILYLFNRKMLAHRAVYELLCGEIANGLHLDHLCRVRCCVNPSHLEPVTPKVNTLRGMSPSAILARKIVCKYGHPLTKSSNESKRRCKTCDRARYKKWCSTNKEKLKLYSKRQSANPKYKEYQKQWRLRNRENILNAGE